MVKFATLCYAVLSLYVWRTGGLEAFVGWWLGYVAAGVILLALGFGLVIIRHLVGTLMQFFGREPSVPLTLQQNNFIENYTAGDPTRPETKHYDPGHSEVLPYLIEQKRRKGV